MRLRRFSDACRFRLAPGAPERAFQPSGERGGGDDKSAETDGLASFSAPRDRSAAEIGAPANLVNARRLETPGKGDGFTSILKSRCARV
jgi:hypothetical protein